MNFTSIKRLKHFMKGHLESSSFISSLPPKRTLVQTLYELTVCHHKVHINDSRYSENGIYCISIDTIP